MADLPAIFQKPFFHPFVSNGSWRERFMNLHPGVEAYLRQILFVGLRQQRVNYEDARKCVYENRVVEDFTAHFQTLFGQNWNVFIQPNPRLVRLWDLFNSQAKPIRNRVFHGMRDYDEEMYRLCFAIDMGLIEELGRHLRSNFNHDFLPPLKGLGLPRVGKEGAAPSQVLSRLRGGSSPRYSDSEEELRELRKKLDEIEVY